MRLAIDLHDGTGVRRIPVPAAPEKLVFGSGPDVHILVQDPVAEGRHFEIENRYGIVLGQDAGGAVPTRVNGVPVTLAALRAGDVIEIGSVGFRVADEAAPPEAEATPSRPATPAPGPRLPGPPTRAEERSRRADLARRPPRTGLFGLPVSRTTARILVPVCVFFLAWFVESARIGLTSPVPESGSAIRLTEATELSGALLAEGRFGDALGVWDRYLADPTAAPHDLVRCEQGRAAIRARAADAFEILEVSLRRLAGSGANQEALDLLDREAPAFKGLAQAAKLTPMREKIRKARDAEEGR